MLQVLCPTIQNIKYLKAVGKLSKYHVSKQSGKMLVKLSSSQKVATDSPWRGGILAFSDKEVPPCTARLGWPV